MTIIPRFFTVLFCCSLFSFYANSDEIVDYGEHRAVIIKFSDLEYEGIYSGTRNFDYLLNQSISHLGVELLYYKPIATGADVFAIKNKYIFYDTVDELIKLLNSLDFIEYAEMDEIANSDYSPNDPFFSSQWSLTDMDSGVDAVHAWDFSKGAGVVVAVIDTGKTPHTDMDVNIIGGYDFISSSSTARDGNGRDSNFNDEGNWCPGVKNSNWHGLNVSSLIAAVTNNGSVMAALAHKSKIVHVRGLGKCGGSTSDLADAIIWASGGAVSGVPSNPNPAQVINLSFGSYGSSCPNTYQSAIDAARANGAFVVGSAGNDSGDANLHPPSNCTGIMAVANITDTGNKRFDSNAGTSVDVAAPGTDVRVLSNTGATVQSSQTSYKTSGTSLSAPIVSAIAALAIDLKPGISLDEIERTIEITAKPFAGTCSNCGSGVASAAGVVDALTPLL